MIALAFLLAPLTAHADTGASCLSVAQHHRIIEKGITGTRAHVPAKLRHLDSRACSPEAAQTEREDFTHHAARHRNYVHRVFQYDRGIKNPLGLRGWPVPYCIAVGESGAGSASSNVFGMLQAWDAYRPHWADRWSAWSAPFWAQAVAVYRTQLHGLGGWATWPC